MGVEVQVVCDYCGGWGGHEVTQDMATDAGEPTMAGQRLTCERCGGDGWIVVEAPERPDK